MFDFTAFGFRGEMTAPTSGHDVKTQAVSRQELSILFQDVLGDEPAIGRHTAMDNGDPILADQHACAVQTETTHQTDFEDVLEMIELPDAPDIPVVREFDCAVDRLFLEFEGQDTDAPHITIDFQTFPGHALVEANGLAIALIIDAEGLASNRVDVLMSGPASPAPFKTCSTKWPVNQAPLMSGTEADAHACASKTTMAMH